MATKTITVGKALKLEYFDNQRLYLVMAIDVQTGEEVALLNLSDDKLQAIAEMEFEGFVDPIFKPIDDFLDQMNDKNT
ncbi:MAG: hypothetical protein ACYSW3_01940 [Planctomycetota bacterium]|jgi:hypothetical protein